MKIVRAFMFPVLVGLLLLPLSGANAGDIPPPGSKPLSVILKSVEDLEIGSVSEAEFDDGVWEVKVCEPGGCQKLYIDPKTGAEKRRRAANFEDIPPPGSMAVSKIVQSVEVRKLGTITEVEYDDGYWEVELRKGMWKTKRFIDPMTGETRR